MATDFTQDTLLHFIQRSGGSVKNSDLLLHFRNFIRDHEDRKRNRELFKKFVNSVATVRQVDGVSYVVLRKKFNGHVAGDGEGGSSVPSRLPAERRTDTSPENATLIPAMSAEKPRQKPQSREVTTPAPSGVTAGKTILPVAGIVLNNNNNTVETNLNLKHKQQQVTSTPELCGRAAAAQVVTQTPKKTQVKTNVGPPAQDQCTKVRQLKVGFGPGVTPVVAAVRHHGENSQQPESVRGRGAHLQPEGGLHQEPPLHPTSVQPQTAPRHIRLRQSYKSAVSYDEDEQEEEEVQVRRGSAGGAWPLSTLLGDMEKALSASSPCIIDPPAPPPITSSSSYTPERKLPKIFIQDVEEETLPTGGWSLQSGGGQGRQWAVSGPKPVSGEMSFARRNLPSEAGRYSPSPDQATEVVPRRQYPKPTDVHLGPNQSKGQQLSSSHSSIFSPSSDAEFSSNNWPLSSSPRGAGRNSSCEDLQAKAGEAGGGFKVQEALQRFRGNKMESVTQHADSETTGLWHSTGHLHDNQEPTSYLSPFHHSADLLHDDQNSSVHVVPWHLSTGDLCDDRDEVVSNEGSTSSQPRRATTRRVSSQLRSRMCRSLGADLDQLLQEEVRAGGGSEATRLNRLHLISSSLSLRYNLSSSSLSSCSTPPSSLSFADLREVRGGRRRSPAAADTANHEGPSRQSLVPLEPREHAWLVKGAAGAWPDIYTLFREDPSLLNRQDFISGFTVLHWIAKHGDHRVLNTLWYGVEKAGLTFDMNAKSTCGHTPLHIAAMHGNKNIMRLLVSKFNADVKQRDTAGKKPWQYLSHTTPPDVFELLGAPSRLAGRESGGVGSEDPSWKPRQPQQRRRRHHLSFASSDERPLAMSGTTRVKRSTSIAAFLKHRSLNLFQGHQSDTSV